MLLGRPFPEWDERTLNVSGKALFSLLEGMAQMGPSGWADIDREAVDAGEAARLLLERARSSPPQSPPLTILEAERTFAAIAQVTRSRPARVTPPAWPCALPG